MYTVLIQTKHELGLNKIKYQQQGKLYLGLQGPTNVQLLDPIRNGDGALQCIIFSVII